jgi:hypothetical protein
LVGNIITHITRPQPQPIQTAKPTVKVVSLDEEFYSSSLL